MPRKKNFLTGIAGLTALIALLLLSTVDCNKDNCQDCTVPDNCPVLHKVCSWGSFDAQQCSSSGGKGCCTTNIAEISCTWQIDYKWSGKYNVSGEKAVIDLYHGMVRTHIEIDARENGWISRETAAAEKELRIREKMEALRLGQL